MSGAALSRVGLKPKPVANGALVVRKGSLTREELARHLKQRPLPLGQTVIVNSRDGEGNPAASIGNNLHTLILVKLHYHCARIPAPASSPAPGPAGVAISFIASAASKEATKSLVAAVTVQEASTVPIFVGVVVILCAGVISGGISTSLVRVANSMVITPLK